MSKSWRVECVRDQTVGSAYIAFAVARRADGFILHSVKAFFIKTSSGALLLVSDDCNLSSSQSAFAPTTDDFSFRSWILKFYDILRARYGKGFKMVSVSLCPRPQALAHNILCFRTFSVVFYDALCCSSFILEWSMWNAPRRKTFVKTLFVLLCFLSSSSTAANTFFRFRIAHPFSRHNQNDSLMKSWTDMNELKSEKPSVGHCISEASWKKMRLEKLSSCHAIWISFPSACAFIHNLHQAWRG